jgi:sugar O-acyltransferase (sialic acid O-acetyltransferase NeuD family)
VKKLLIYGTGILAETVLFYFENDGRRKVAALTADDAFLGGQAFPGHPVVPWAEILKKYPPSEYDFFVAIGYRHYNDIRAQKCALVRAAGYSLTSFIHSSAIIAPGVLCGANALILENTVIQPFARLGDGVGLWSGSLIAHHSSIGDYCFLASQVAVSSFVTMGPNCFVGVNATLRDCLTIGERCLIGAGALVLQDLPAKSFCVPRGTPIASFSTDDFNF